MFLRENSGTTVQELAPLLDPATLHTSTDTELISVRLACAEPSIRWGEHEIPANGTGIVALGNILDIPSKFLGRLDPDVQETLLNTMLARSGSEEVRIDANDQGVVDVYPANFNRLPAAEVVGIASRVVGNEGRVIDWRRDNTGYGFEVIIPEMAEYGFGGDPSVGDITHGGLRFGQDLKHGLAPWVQEYVYRLVCTNGMEIPDRSLKVSIKGSTLDEIVAELEQKAEEAFGRVESTIASFYELRNERVSQPEQTLARLAREHGLTDKALAEMIRQLPEYMAADGTVSMFDLVNLLTNQANDPALVGRFGSRRKLEVVGGTVALDHSSRCPQCRSKID